MSVSASLVPRLPSFVRFAWPPNKAGKPGNEAMFQLYIACILAKCMPHKFDL